MILSLPRYDIEIMSKGYLISLNLALLTGCQYVPWQIGKRDLSSEVQPMLEGAILLQQQQASFQINPLSSPC